MALATGPVLCDPLHYFPSSPFGGEIMASPQFPLFDMDLITSAPPALLPTGSISLQSCWSSSCCSSPLPSLPPPPPPPEQQQQQAQFQVISTSGGGGGAVLQSVSTPVMHPNLVSTLKSMITLSPTSSESGKGTSGGGGDVSCWSSDGSGDELQKRSGSGNGRRTALKSKRKHGLLHQHLELPDMYSLSSSPNNNRASYSSNNYNHNSQSHPTGTGAGEVSMEVEDDDEAAVVPVDLIQNRRPFKCEYNACNKTFKNPQTMKMHHKTHYADDSSYRLGVSSHSLSTFKAGHNKKIPSRCPICKKTFVGLYELRRHYGRKHSEGEKTFGCKKCGKKFYIEVDLRDHEKLCGKPIECKCRMKFAFKCNLVAHKKHHPECQDDQSTSSGSEEVDHHKQRQQQRTSASASSSSRRSRAGAGSTALPAGSSRFSSVSVSPPVALKHLSTTNPWVCHSPSQDNLSSGGMSMSSDCSYPAVTSISTTGAPSPLASSRSPGGGLIRSSNFIAC